MSDLSKLWSKKTKRLFVQALQGESQTRKSDFPRFNLSIITQFFPPDYAATGQLIQELAAELGKKNIQVDIFTGQPGYAYKQQKAPAIEIDKNIRIQRSTVRQFCSRRIRGKTLNGVVFTLMAARYLWKNARQRNTVIVTTAPPFLAIIGYLGNLLFKLEYICLVYDLYPDAVVELGVISEKGIVAKIWNRLNTMVWGRSKKIVVLSDTMKQRIVARHPKISTKVSVIHNWADATWIRPINKAENWFAEQYRIDRQFTVLYSGNFGHCHDLDTIMKAAKLLRKEPIKFVFIGAGAKHQHCLTKAAELSLHNCMFLPYQERANLPYSLTACDLALVSIAPGLEGVIAPSKVYGIMAAGKAIAAICEPRSYLRHLLDEAGCGAAFNNHHAEELANFIVSLARNPQQASRMGNLGRGYLLRNFTPQIAAQKYCEVLGIDSAIYENNRDVNHVLYGMVESHWPCREILEGK